ncbi:hypothetical protein BCF33_2670 [Hasllibacter halocynthiae]|uniref:Uncharacterized protein n=1 Tax=Hasllibacter halocynthiae TaxID=595589 RepID=A0A2T0X4F3_9RHOB|nr:hypothetical protein [Hasllibacter halocynthiae]PRY93785.1 hypothetical protein BCF33_2670 [Hasllibacter halocynthiae]
MTQIPSPASMAPDTYPEAADEGLHETPAQVAAAKRRAAGLSQGAAMDEAQERAIRRLAGDLHRLNHAVTQAVEAGVTIELVRASRHHGGNGNWGDMMVPVVVRR